MKKYLFGLLVALLSFTINYSAQAANNQNININQTPIIATSSVYIDMGVLYGNYIETSKSGIIVWWPEPAHLDTAKLNAFLTTFFTKLKSDGVNDVRLSFAQLRDIDFLSGESGAAQPSPTDTVAQIFNPVYYVGTTQPLVNFLTYFISTANSYGINAGLSFGGENAQPTDMKIINQSGETAAGQATKLLGFLNSYQFSSVDFDIEGSNVTDIVNQNSEQILIDFFQTLHAGLSSNQKSYITLTGGVAQGPQGDISFLFDSFNTYFDGIFLMLYSNNQYYIDANNVTWGIEQWAQYVPYNQIHVGFFDSILYEDNSSSAGENYHVPSTDTRGQAAAFIYTSLINNLQSVNGFTNLNAPFWWTKDPVALSTNQVLTDFYDALTATVMPPTNLRINQNKNTNVLKWNAPPLSKDIVSYQVYRDSSLTQLIVTIPARSKVVFTDYNVKKKNTYTYYVVSINRFGTHSIPIMVSTNDK